MRYKLNNVTQYFEIRDGVLVIVSMESEVRLVPSDLQRLAMAVLDSGVSLDFNPYVQLVESEYEGGEQLMQLWSNMENC